MAFGFSTWREEQLQLSWTQTPRRNPRGHHVTVTRSQNPPRRRRLIRWILATKVWSWLDCCRDGNGKMQPKNAQSSNKDVCWRKCWTETLQTVDLPRTLTPVWSIGKTWHKLLSCIPAIKMTMWVRLRSGIRRPSVELRLKLKKKKKNNKASV